ncbi:hypothetical protein RHSIM_Rhsim05G0197600 [Rhododendron simsii]|uniref:Albumin-2 n=1 Tax=Rhododendron simsii TaxID=118357 RepID=A0A834GX52_RHOSS|nr:hypothetical protein RHSIM_Rhsim05G0197600 [Rhododendron simsii]
MLNIQRPIFDYKDPAIGRNEHLTISIYRPPAISEREKQVVSLDSTITNWYAGDVANYKGYINAAFRSSHKNEAYLFMMNEYLLLNYAPGTTDDKIKYAPGTTNDKIIKGPITITAMFPLFKGTIFESGIDAAFEATNKGEAYLFKDNQYALINYSSDSKLIEVRRITQAFPSLKNTIFESEIDAAFASHRTDEAYIFKGDSYALFDFAPGTTNDYIIGSAVKKILPNWPSLANVLPCKNLLDRGLKIDKQGPRDLFSLANVGSGIEGFVEGRNVKVLDGAYGVGGAEG